MPTSPAPEAGAIENGVHRLAMRIYYEDTDAGGLVYHANYLKFAERARTELLRCLGLDHATLRERYGLAFTVRSLSIEFLAPARLDDRLIVATRLLRPARAALELDQQIARADGRLLARLAVRLALLSGDLRVARPPSALRTALAPLRLGDRA
jgi:acyl-CoA thioester hydrolase